MATAKRSKKLTAAQATALVRRNIPHVILDRIWRAADNAFNARVADRAYLFKIAGVA